MLDTVITDAETARSVAAEVTAMLARRAIAFRAPPPEPATCCGRGCNGCVWEGYFAAFAWWREEAARLLAQAAP